MSPRRTTRSSAKGKTSPSVAKGEPTQSTTVEHDEGDSGGQRPKTSSRGKRESAKNESDVANRLFDDDVEIIDKPIRVQGSSSNKRRAQRVSSDKRSADGNSEDGSAIVSTDAESGERYDYLNENLDRYESSFINDETDGEDDGGKSADVVDVEAGEDAGGGLFDWTEDESEPDVGHKVLNQSPTKRQSDTIAEGSSPAKKPRRGPVAVYDSDSEAVQLPLSHYMQLEGNHPFNLDSEIGKMWFGATPYLLATHQYEAAQVWREKKYMRQRETIDNDPYRKLQFTDFNYLLEEHLLGKYSEWLDIALQEKYHDEVWMERYDHPNFKHLPSAVELNVEDTNETPVAGQTVASGSTRKYKDGLGWEEDEQISTAAPKSAGKGKERAREESPAPRTPSKSAASSAPKTPSGKKVQPVLTTPTTAVANQLEAMTLSKRDAQMWAERIVDHGEDLPMPGVDMRGLEYITERFPEIMPGSVELRDMNLVDDLLRKGALTRRGQANLAVLTSTPVFKPWLQNLALIPEAMLSAYPDPNGVPPPGQMELRRKSTRAGESNGKVAFVMFGSVSADSNLLRPHSVQIPGQRLSKSVNIVPLDDHFKRIYSLLFKLFDLSVLKLSVYQHGLTFRTRLVTGVETAPIGNAIGTNSKKRFNPNAMPSYLSTLQKKANEDIPVYDATAYFIGDKIRRPFTFGTEDVLCPKLQRELRPTDFVAVIHSINTYPSGLHGGHGLSFNVYYAVLLVPGN